MGYWLPWMTGLRTVPEEGFRTKLSSINIPRSWKNGAQTCWGMWETHHSIYCNILVLVLVFLREKERVNSHHGFEITLVYNVKEVCFK